MEAAPPSYEKATLNDYWDIIAGYIPSSDLCAAALVCSKWHATFIPHLWGNPASHFGVENDRVYVALTKFKRTLQTARLFVRTLTHTLHLPPAHAEIYNGPHANWLRDILSRLPNLQSLIVRGLPFFDHAAMQALRYQPPKHTSSSSDDPLSQLIELPGSVGTVFEAPEILVPSFGLRLLDASRCPNLTPSGLAHALRRFESLMYLDLSYTFTARDPAVLSAIRRISGLQVLKLRGISLRDEGLEILAKAIGRRVRSLDLRKNLITDRGIRTLLESSFILSPQEMDACDGVASGARSPSLLSYLGAETMSIYQGEDFESYLRKTFTKAFVSRLAIEDCPEGGITNLYISDNAISVEGVSGLIRSQRLHVLDVGSVDIAAVRSPAPNDDTVWGLPGAEKLMPVLKSHAADGLTFLRLDHSLITKAVPDSHPDEVIPGRVELADTALPDLPRNVAELDGTSVVTEAYEMPTDQQTPRYELPGDPMQFVVSPAINDDQRYNESATGPRRGSLLAPEVVEDPPLSQDQWTLLSPVSTLGESTMMGGVSPVSVSSPIGQSLLVHLPSRPRTYSSVTVERKTRIQAHVVREKTLHPAMLPHLRTLILTDVPAFSPDKSVAGKLVSFVTHCAEEAMLADTQAKLDYSLPPGRRGQRSALKHSADKIFALQRIVLEVAPEDTRRLKANASQWQHTTSRSLTEDRDTEKLWSAAETDFSFFGQDDDVSFPSIETGRFAANLGSDEKQVTFGTRQDMAPRDPQQPPIEVPKVDNIAILSAFRKERKIAHDRSIAAGAIDPNTEGYWTGSIQVVRPGSGIGEGEEVDYYGNRFSNFYLYR